MGQIRGRNSHCRDGRQGEGASAGAAACGGRGSGLPRRAALALPSCAAEAVGFRVPAARRHRSSVPRLPSALCLAWRCGPSVGRAPQGRLPWEGGPGSGLPRRAALVLPPCAAESVLFRVRADLRHHPPPPHLPAAASLSRLSGVEGWDCTSRWQRGALRLGGHRWLLQPVAFLSVTLTVDRAQMMDGRPFCLR